MRNGKFAKRGVATKSMVMILALVLVIGCVIGGTLAWLTDKTGTVTNTFSVGNIDLLLQEHTYDPATQKLEETLTDTGNDDYKFVPGDTLPKDPFVTVEKGSEACWLFIHVVETNNTLEGLNGKIISYTIDSSVWTAVPNHDGYYYCEVDYATADVVKNIITNKEVTINSAVTKDMTATIAEKAPSLAFTAAAVQKDNVADVNTAFGYLPEGF